VAWIDFPDSDIRWNCVDAGLILELGRCCRAGSRYPCVAEDRQKISGAVSLSSAHLPCCLLYRLYTIIFPIDSSSPLFSQFL
jgi:hypothetical protein